MTYPQFCYSQLLRTVYRTCVVSSICLVVVYYMSTFYTYFYAHFIFNA